VVITKIGGLVLPTLIMVLILCLQPAETRAAPVILPISLTFKQGVVPITSINVTLGSTFTLDVILGSAPPGFSLIGYLLEFTWDSSQVELIGASALAPDGANGWSTGTSLGSQGNSVTVSGRGGDTTKQSFTAAHLIFRCRAVGTSTITAAAPPEKSIDLVPDEGGLETHTTIGPLPLVCNQSPPLTVGGIVMSVNKHEVLAPYLTLAGLIALASVVVVVRKRKD
jgi:hypothetical protein